MVGFVWRLNGIKKKVKIGKIKRKKTHTEMDGHDENIFQKRAQRIILEKSGNMKKWREIVKV